MKELKEIKIKNIDLLKKGNIEHIQYHIEFAKLINKYKIGTLHNLNTLFLNYITLLEIETKALIWSDESNLNEIMDLEVHRDSVFVGFVAIVNAETKHYQKKIRDAAMKIKLRIDLYKLSTDRYNDDKTNSINKIIKELNASYPKEIKLMGLRSWLKNLQRDNSVLEKLVKKWALVNGEEFKYKIKKVRSEVDEAYWQIVEYMNALALIFESNSDVGFIHEINDKISRYELACS